MPPIIIMHNRTVPLGSLLASKSKSNHQVLPPPELRHTLYFDSTRLLSGLLSSSKGIEYAIATRGTRTGISCPGRSSNLAVIEWEEGWVETEGLRLGLAEWMDGPKWGYSSTHVFNMWGNNPAIKWEVRDSNWKATNSQKQILATFIVRRGTLTTRIELTDIGKPYADALVLTGILCATNKKEWKWYNSIQVRKDAVEARSRGSAEGISIRSLTPGQLSDEALPTYREAPFTRSLDPLLYYPLASSDQENGLNFSIDQPPKFALASERVLDGN